MLSQKTEQKKTFKVNILKLPETNGITAVDLTENKVAATYKDFN